MAAGKTGAPIPGCFPQGRTRSLDNRFQQVRHQWCGDHRRCHQQRFIPAAGNQKRYDHQDRQGCHKSGRTAQRDGIEDPVERLGDMSVHKPQNCGLKIPRVWVRCQCGSFQFLPFFLSGASTHAATALNACPPAPGRAPASHPSAHAMDSPWDLRAWAVHAGFLTRGWAASC